ncbi:hypothetical protein HDC36_002724 [Xanthomonas sp. JAI131]|jgi:hypothetical protein|uniref:hypothetical protein n=1 Tax=Xanthomonas sp. JAI131 TaxID=2723067 RepID=UPI0015CEC236|nr:hypothetical protein [Xanthomonas sp. JAI131]NYF21255.1 hypothetical protein [Xanthomonas sp. JAI131]
MTKKLLAATLALLAGSAACVPALAAENPVDQAGIQHNMYLGCLMDLNASPDDALTLLVKKCGYAPGVPLERFIATQQPIVDSIDPTRPLTENLPGLRQQFNSYEYSFLVRMDQIVENAVDMDAAAAQFEALEREAIARLDPKSENGALILGGLSVARHSNRYWSKQAAESGVTSKGRFWKWLAVVAADVGGFFASANNAATAATVSHEAHDMIFGTTTTTPPN